MSRLIVTVAVAMLVGGATQAQSTLTGKWQGATPNGAQLVLDVTATDSALTGTLTRNDQTVTIAEGKVKGKTFSFKATLGDQPDGFSGELTGDEIKIWLERQGPERAITLTRVKR